MARGVQNPKANGSTARAEETVISALGREVIDARGSIDSRTLDEEGRITSIAKDKRDRHEASVDAGFSRSRWRSHAGGVGFSGGVLSGGADYGRPEKGIGDVPTFFKVALPVIVGLVVLVIALAFR